MRSEEDRIGSKAKMDVYLSCPVLSLKGNNLICFTPMLKLTHVVSTVNSDIFIEQPCLPNMT